MANSPAQREANDPAADYAQQITEEVRSRIAPEDWVLDETRNRRGKVGKTAERFRGALRSFASGSLAHRTVNNPISDGDAGLVLNRVVWFQLGPDGGGEGPDAVMRELGQFVCDELRDEYPRISFELTKRAILFEFHEPMDDEDPSVDLVVCLTRRDEPGYWIPNRERDRWDASDPETHTKLMTAPPADLRQHRAQVIRLTKAAIRGDDEQAVLCSWNISALALDHIEHVGKHVETLATFFEAMAESIQTGPTPDPAGVSAPIKLPEGITREKAVARLRFFAVRVREAVAHRHDHARALAALADVFPAQLSDAPRSPKSRIADELRRGAVGPAVSGVSVRSRRRRGRSAMRRRKPQPWHTDIRARLRFERGARSRHPDVRCSTIGRGHGALVTYRLTVPVPEYESRSVTIELVNGYNFGAKITVDGPTESPHRYSDESLCIWLPSDSQRRKWVGSDGLGELIRQIAVHLFKEAYWRETGEWLGPEAPHASPKHPDDRRTET